MWTFVQTLWKLQRRPFGGPIAFLAFITGVHIDMFWSSSNPDRGLARQVQPAPLPSDCLQFRYNQWMQAYRSV